MDIEDFKNPGAIYRSAPFWSWNDRLDEDELKRQIDEMADKGWGAFFMHSRVGLVTPYLSSEWMKMIKVCVEHAKATGIYAWLYDEDKWPSGYAGGAVPKNMEYRSRALVLEKIDHVSDNVKILDDVEHNGEKYYICKMVSSYGNPRFNDTSFVDLMNPEAVKAFINCTHEKYKEVCGESFGKEIPGVFTDESCYHFVTDYNMPAVPWSDYLPQFFRELKGYSIEEHLKELFFDVNDFRKVRFDFYEAATKLFRDSYTKQYFNWCSENKLILTGHFMGEDDLAYQTQWIGAAMPQYEFMHWPGIDKLFKNLYGLVTTKQLTSVADQLGKERALSEAYGGGGQQFNFLDRKWISDWQAVLGISFVNSHLSCYSMRGERKRDWPANLFFHQAWWENEKKFADYIGRLSYVMTLGKRDVDILVIHPIGSVWSEYSPLHRKNKFLTENELYNNPFQQLSDLLIANKLDFHYGDEIIMENHASLIKGKLVVGNHSYSTVIVPPSITLKANTISLLTGFSNASETNKLIFINQYPERIDGVQSEIKWPKNTMKLDKVDDCIKVLDNWYSNRISIIDKMTGENAYKIICNQRTCEKEKYILIANTDKNREISAVITLPGTSKPVAMDIATGNIYKIPVRIPGDKTEIEVRFYPAGSLLLLYPEQDLQAEQSPPYLDSGVQFNEISNTIDSICRWDVNQLEYNVLPISDITLYLGGKLIFEKQHVVKAWHELFFKWTDRVPEGKAFKVEYSFDVLSVPKGEIYAVIEVAENLDAITLNGQKLNPLKSKGEFGRFDPEKSWKDINFTKLKINGLIKTGTNIICIEGRKCNNIVGPGWDTGLKDDNNHFPTEIEAVYIIGDFTVRNEDNIRLAIDGNKQETCYKDLMATGFPFYSGRVELKSKIAYQKQERNVYLRINKVEAACIELHVNGKYVDVKYYDPYIFDVSGYLCDGQNEITVIASNTLYNLEGPTRLSGVKNLEYVSPFMFADRSLYTEKYQLLPFGIGTGDLIYK